MLKLLAILNMKMKDALHCGAEGIRNFTVFNIVHKMDFVDFVHKSHYVDNVGGYSF